MIYYSQAPRAHILGKTCKLLLTGCLLNECTRALTFPEFLPGKYLTRSSLSTTCQYEADIMWQDLVSHEPEGEWSKVSRLWCIHTHIHTHTNTFYVHIYSACILSLSLCIYILHIFSPYTPTPTHTHTPTHPHTGLPAAGSQLRYRVPGQKGLVSYAGGRPCNPNRKLGHSARQRHAMCKKYFHPQVLRADQRG